MAMIAQSFPSLDAFYAADARRRHSRERDVGLFWRGRETATGLGELLSTIRGYHEVCGRRGSLGWFLDRVGTHTAAAAA